MSEIDKELVNFQVQQDQIVFMCPLGRGGSILMHVLLASHPEINTTECFIRLNEEIISQYEMNTSFIKIMCSNQLGKLNNLWLLDWKEVNEKKYEFENHENCKCRKLFNGKQTILLHVHNILYDLHQFELFNQLLDRYQKVSLLICHRDWLENISARQRNHPIANVPRWISILYWIEIEEIANANLEWLSNRIIIHKVDLTSLHMETDYVWSGILDFLKVSQMPIPTSPKVRDLFWLGGNKSGKVVNQQYAKYLKQIDLSEQEIRLVKFFSSRKHGILKYGTKACSHTGLFCISFLSIERIHNEL